MHDTTALRRSIRSADRGRRRAARALLLGLVTLAAAACGTDEGDVVADAGAASTTSSPPTSAPDEQSTTTEAPAGCDTEGWQTVDVEAFTFLLPPDVVDQEAQGIDSLVGQYEGEGLEVSFDYGWYSGSDAPNDYLDPLTTDIEVDGFPARIVAAPSDQIFGSGPGANPGDTTRLVVADVEGADGAMSSGLGMWVTYEDDALAPTAECIVRSVDFAAPAPAPG